MCIRDSVRRACYEILSRGERPSRPTVQDLLATDRYIGRKGGNELVQNLINDFWMSMSKTLQVPERTDVYKRQATTRQGIRKERTMPPLRRSRAVSKANTASLSCSDKAAMSAAVLMVFTGIFQRSIHDAMLDALRPFVKNKAASAWSRV